jgi:hypothetical protein
MKALAILGVLVSLYTAVLCLPTEMLELAKFVAGVALMIGVPSVVDGLLDEQQG